ncbi:hypothetical protein AX17_005526 [Amanita inopinata Kibby_2008]|nr:hypothetical protein AX17_005526 [Amanita inopinata Kibby_2008]
MPICTSCTNYIPYLYTIYESAYNLRLEQCTKCQAFADPYVEHDSLTLLLDLILLKRGVYRHLLYNRGSEPRKASNSGKEVETSPAAVNRKALLDEREKKRWLLALKLGTVLIFLDAFIRWCHLKPDLPPAGSPWTLDTLTHFIRVVLGCFAETVAFQFGIGLMCSIMLALSKVVPTTRKAKVDIMMPDIREEFRFSLIPLTLFYSSLAKLFLLFQLTIWRPSTTPIAPPAFENILFRSSISGASQWSEYMMKAFVTLDDDKIDKEWFVRNILGGMSAGFGLRVILDAHPLLTMLVIVVGWAFKTLAASMVSHWVGGSELIGDAWLAYSIP